MKKTTNSRNFADMAKAKKTAVKKAETTSALAITKKGTEKLSSNQAAFNKLATRIEKIRKEIERKEAQLDEAVILYGQTVPPLEDEVIRQRHQLLLLMYPFYQQKKLPKTLHPYLKDMLQNLISDVLQNSPDEADDELKAIFTELEGEDYETVLKREEKEMEEEMRQTFKSFGVDMNWEEDTKLSEEEMTRKLHEFQQQVQEKKAEEQRRWKEQYKTRPKTAKQVEKEKAEQAAEQAKQKNISTIYRQLAKLFHPDLEQDEDRRMEKEVLMKQLTEAYETKNLHTLLMLELKWIHNETNHIESLTEEKLGVYLDILRSQATELETQKWHILQQPRYGFLVKRYGFRPLTYPVKTVKENINDLQLQKKEIDTDIAGLQGQQAAHYLKNIVQDWRDNQKLLQQSEHDLNNILGMMFSNGGKW